MQKWMFLFLSVFLNEFLREIPFRKMHSYYVTITMHSYYVTITMHSYYVTVTTFDINGTQTGEILIFQLFHS